MACSIGESHTIAVSNEGIAYSFGNNTYGALGIDSKNKVSIPTPIPNLPVTHWFPAEDFLRFV